MFREAKQAWFIERSSVNTKAGFQAHTYLTVLVMALTTAFQLWMDQQDKLEKVGKETGIRKFREKVREENGSQLIIFNKDRYAIFLPTKFSFCVVAMSSAPTEYLNE